MREISDSELCKRISDVPEHPHYAILFNSSNNGHVGLDYYVFSNKEDWIHAIKDLIDDGQDGNFIPLKSIPADVHVNVKVVLPPFKQSAYKESK